MTKINELAGWNWFFSACSVGDGDSNCVLLTPAVLNGLGERKTPVMTGLLNELTSPQLELLAMIAQGYSNQEIAIQKNLAVQTVKNQASAIFKLLNAKNRIEAISIYRSTNR